MERNGLINAAGKQNDFERLRAYLTEARRDGMSRLPPEPRLSDELGVSRGRLRTLLKRMEAEGLIWRHVGKGTFLGQRELAAQPRLVSEQISLENVMQARLAIEPQLAAHAAIHATAADLKEIEGCLARMAAETSLPAWKGHDDTLHMEIARASHNALLILVFETMKAEIAYQFETRIIEVFNSAAIDNPRGRTEQEHAAIVDAIKRHDPAEAERAMRDHILSVRSSLFGTR